jgi:hypothetical protein
MVMLLLLSLRWGMKPEPFFKCESAVTLPLFLMWKFFPDHIVKDTCCRFLTTGAYSYIS